MVDQGGFSVGPTNMPTQQLFSFGGGQGGSAFGQFSPTAAYARDTREAGGGSFFRNSAISDTSGQSPEAASGSTSISDVVGGIDSALKLYEKGSSFFSGGETKAPLDYGPFTSNTAPVGMGPVVPEGGIPNSGSFLSGSQAFGSDGFAGSLGSSGADLIGNGVANFAAGYLGTKLGGLIGNGGVGANVGGTIGGAIGSAWGPIGSFAGSTIGSVLGGFFGSNKKPNPAGGVGGVSVGEQGTLQGGEYSGKHMKNETFTPYISEFEDYLKKETSKYGIKLSPDAKLYIGYDVNGSSFKSTKDTPYQLTAYNIKDNQSNINNTVLSPSTTFSWDNPEQKKKSFENVFKQLATISGYDPAKLTPVTNTPTGSTAGGNIFNVDSQRQESAFDKFLKDYREKQNANLA